MARFGRGGARKANANDSEHLKNRLVRSNTADVVFEVIGLRRSSTNPWSSTERVGKWTSEEGPEDRDVPGEG